MKATFYILWLLFISHSFIVGQNLTMEFREYYGIDNNGNTQYAAQSSYPTLGIADDFGSRQNGNDLYDWHGGIDYNDTDIDGDIHDLIIAVENGRVHGNMLSGTSPKYVVIEGADHNFNYLHLFHDGTIIGNAYQTSGGCELRRPDPPYDMGDYWTIIFEVFGTISAIGNIPNNVNATVSSPNYINGTPIPISNSVTNTFPMIGPVGNSGMDSNMYIGVHCHLGLTPSYIDIPWNDNTAKNPLEYVDHRRPNYMIDILKQDDITNGIDLIYPGDDETTIQVRVKMDLPQSQQNAKRYDDLMDVEKTEFKIKKKLAYDIFRPVKGPYYNRIELGGTHNGTRMPNGMINDGSSPYIGNWSRTGVQPIAYATNNAHPYDDFYFADFVTRIHKNDPMDGGTTSTMIANCPDKARYIDGEYLLKGVVTDVRGTIHEGPKDASGNIIPIEFTLDNFKPFVKRVQVFYGSSTVVYKEEWDCSLFDCITFSNNNLQTQFNCREVRDRSMLVKVRTSEQMKTNSMRMHIPNLNILNRIPIYSGSGLDYFIFEIKATEINGNSLFLLQFSGNDNNYNSLISFNSSHKTKCINVPTRESEITWNDLNTPNLTYGIDHLHSFSISCGSGGFNYPNGTTSIFLIGDEIELTADISNTFEFDCNEGIIDLHVKGGCSEEYTFEWSNGETTEDLSGLLPGKYCVTVTDPMCGFAEECFIVPEVPYTGDAYIGIVKQVSRCTPNPLVWTGYYTESNDGILCLSYPNNFPNYTAYWSDGYIGTGACRYNVSTGTYSVLLVLDNGCEIKLDEVEVCCCENPTSYPNHPNIPFCNNTSSGNIEKDIEIEKAILIGSNNNDGSIQLFINTNLDVTYKWSDPNLPNSGLVTGLSPGIYCVTVSYARCGDEDSSDSGCYEIIDCSTTNIQMSETLSNICYDSENNKYYKYGAISLDVSGGSPPYNFSWSNGDINQNLNNLTEGGEYCVTVTDKYNCGKIACYNLEVSVGTTERIGETCEFNEKCDGEIVNTYDIGSYWGYDPNDCTYEVKYCNDGFEIDRRFVGFDLDRSYFFDDNCYAVLRCYNGEDWREIYGQNCRDCVFELVPQNDDDEDGPQYVYCCHIDYCYYEVYFDEGQYLDFSRITNIDEDESAYKYIVGESEDCGFGYDNCCLDEGDPGFRHIEIHPCESEEYEYYFKDADCSDVYEFNVNYSGRIGDGDCFGSPVIEESYEKIIPVHVNNIFNLEEIKLDGNNFKNFVKNRVLKINSANVSADCSQIRISFDCDREGESKITLWDLNNIEDIINLDYSTLIGQNNLTIKGVNIVSGEYLMVVKHGDKELWSRLNINCKNSSSIVNDINYKNNIVIYPNPTSGKVKINIPNGESLNLEIYVKNILGEVRLYKEIHEKSKVNIDISPFIDGLYFIELFKNNEKIYTGKLIKIN